MGNIFGSFDYGAIAAISFSFVCIHINSCMGKNISEESVFDNKSSFFFRTMALSHVPTNLTAYENLEIERIAKMTSFECNDSNVVEVNGVRLEILTSDLIVLPIPENRSSSNTSVQIGVYITNNTPTPFHFSPNDTLIPELITSDGQALQGQVVTDEPLDQVKTNTLIRPGFRFRLIQLISNLVRSLMRSEARKFNERLIHSGEGEYLSLTARLIWHNSNLQLQFINEYSYLSNIFRLENSWSFDALQARTYQLQFTYRSLSNSEPSSEPEMREGIGTKLLKTQLVNLRLIEPLAYNNSAVEVDSIRFQILMPERTLNIPPTQANASNSVQIGICITNHTTIALRFNLFATLIPKLMKANGQAVQGWRARIGTIKPSKSDFSLAIPGECITFFPYAKLLWCKGDQFTLSIATGDGSFWTFEALKPDIYQIQFTYNNKYAVAKTYNRTNSNTNLIESLWIGTVATPCVTFRLDSGMN